MKNAFLESDLDCKHEDCLDRLEVLYEKKVFKTKPKKCPFCQCKDIEGLEILGAKEGALFWECNRCMYKFLRYNRKITIEYLEEAGKYWFNPDDWKNKERN